MSKRDYPIGESISDFPSGNPPAGEVWRWRTSQGFAEKRPDGSIQYFTPDQAYAPGSASTAPISHAAIAAIVDKAIADIKKQQTIESANTPDFDNPNWITWIQYIYDFSVPTANVNAWIRSPISNDAFPLPPWTFAQKLPTATDSVPSATLAIARDIALPQGVLFRYIPGRGDIAGAIHVVSFPKGTFSGISSQLLDAARAVISGSPRSQTIAADSTGEGLGFASVPANATIAQFIFQYKNGGNVTYEYPIT